MRHARRIIEPMAKPKKGSGKTSEWREDLNSFRRTDLTKFAAEVERVKQIYIRCGNVGQTAKELDIGKRTLERAMGDVPELQSAIDSARVMMGR